MAFVRNLWHRQVYIFTFLRVHYYFIISLVITQKISLISYKYHWIHWILEIVCLLSELRHLINEHKKSSTALSTPTSKHHFWPARNLNTNCDNKQVHLFEVRPRGIYIKFSRLSFSSDVSGIYLASGLANLWRSLPAQTILRFYDSINEEINDSTSNGFFRL